MGRGRESLVLGKKNVHFRYEIEPHSRVVIARQQPLPKRQNRKRDQRIKDVRESAFVRDDSNPAGRRAVHQLTDQQIAELAVISKNPNEFIWRINKRSFVADEEEVIYDDGPTEAADDS